MEGIWLTWEKQRRNHGISSALNYKLYEITSKAPRLLRYIVSSFLTIKLLVDLRPKVVCAQNPSIVLALLIVSLKPFFRYKAIIDAHNSGIFPSEGRSKILMFISKRIQRSSDLVLVTNIYLKTHVETNGGKSFVLPDRLPEPKLPLRRELEGKVNVVYVCTFADDEPFLEAMRAAALLPEDIIIYVTGRYQRKLKNIPNTRNLRMLGYIPEDQYWAFLASADIVMDLTLREHCLVCGAYEAISLSKPTILSKTGALQSYFRKGCAFAEPNADDIARVIVEVSRMIARYKADAGKLKSELSKDWNERLHDLTTTIKGLFDDHTDAAASS